jgi:hypothetical protein
MRRLARWTFTARTAPSLLLCAAAVVLWGAELLRPRHLAGGVARRARATARWYRWRRSEVGACEQATEQHGRLPLSLASSVRPFGRTKRRECEIGQAHLMPLVACGKCQTTSVCRFPLVSPSVCLIKQSSATEMKAVAVLLASARRLRKIRPAGIDRNAPPYGGRGTCRVSGSQARAPRAIPLWGASRTRPKRSRVCHQRYRARR